MSSPLPRITLVTPSFNQGQFIARTIQSVLSQNYPSLDYRIYDGGSSDDSVAIIKRHETGLSRWVSEPDRGPYSAILRGFAEGNGEIMGWINSDDILLPWALATVGEIFRDCPEIQWITTTMPCVISGNGAIRFTGAGMDRGFSRAAFLNGEFCPVGDWFTQGWIQQESTFWRRSLWNAVNPKTLSDYKVGYDFGLWAEFFKIAEPFSVPHPLGAFRGYSGTQRSGSGDYIPEVKQVFANAGGVIPDRRKQRLRRFFLGKVDSKFRHVGLATGWLVKCRTVNWSRGDDCWKSRDCLG